MHEEEGQSRPQELWKWFCTEELLEGGKMTMPKEGARVAQVFEVDACAQDARGKAEEYAACAHQLVDSDEVYSICHI
jgi:hypothetical protein